MKEFTETQGNNIKQFDMTQSHEKEENLKKNIKISQKNEHSIKNNTRKEDFMGSTVQSQDLNDFSKKEQSTKTIKKTTNFSPLQKKVK